MHGVNEQNYTYQPNFNLLKKKQLQFMRHKLKTINIKYFKITTMYLNDFIIKK